MVSRLLVLGGMAALTACTSSGTGSSTSSSTGSSGTSGASGMGSSGMGSTSSSGGPVNVQCNSPAGTVTLCDVQNPSSPGHPSPDTEVTFPDPVTVTSDVFTLTSNDMGVVKAFFVAEGSGGPYRAGLVKGPADQVDALGITVGSLINLQVRVEEFQGTGSGTETQLHLLGGNVVPGTGTVPDPTVVAVGTFGSDTSAEAYEGVLLRVENVTAIRFDSGARTEFGAFRLDGGLYVDDLFFKHDPGVGETFSSITGFVRYAFDGKWMILPRTAADVVSSGNALAPVDVSVVNIQDPANLQNLPHCIAPAECDLVRLQNMVVTSNPRVADRNSAGVATLYSVFLQDPTALDANGEPLPYSGVKLVWARGIESTYAFTVYGEQDFPDTRDNPQDWPMVGDIITVTGSPQEYFDQTQVGAVRSISKVGTVADMTLPFATVPKAKSVEGEMNLAGLSGGSPGVAGCESLPMVAPGADTEKWEGVLLKLVNVSTTLACVPTSSNNTQPPACLTQDFGYFRVTGGVEVGTGQGTFFAGRCPTGETCTCGGPVTLPEDTRMDGRMFTSITGILEYTFSVFRLNPRSNADLVAAP